MKKLAFILAAFALLFPSCDSGNIIGGRYYGTFHNITNDMREAGSLSFTRQKTGNSTSFLMNDLIPMTQDSENHYSATAGDQLLKDFLKTVPAIDSIHVCDSAETIILLDAEAEFKSNSVKANLHFTTSNDSANVEVEFIGIFE